MVTAETILNDGENRKVKSVEALKIELSRFRTGRANPSMVDHIIVDYFGTATPLNTLASITAPEPNLLVIQPWDRQSLPEIEKAILKSPTGLNPASDGSLLRISIPVLTEDRRRELVKIVRKTVEDGRIEVRNIRRDILNKLRTMEKNNEISQDEGRRAQAKLQQLTDSYISQMDATGDAKEKEVMEV